MSELLKFHFPIAVLTHDGTAIADALETHTELNTRLPDGYLTATRAALAKVAAGNTAQKSKRADVGDLTLEQNNNLAAVKNWMSKARQTAGLAFFGQTVKLHEEFQVGINTPTDLASVLTRADIILAALGKAANLPALKSKGWIEADTTAFQTVRATLGDADENQEIAKGGAKDATGTRNKDANDAYDHLAAIQNAADLQWPADASGNSGVRDEFRMNTYPPRGGSSSPTPPPTPPAPPATPKP